MSISWIEHLHTGSEACDDKLKIQSATLSLLT
jgi:hypothetical protein